MQDGLIVLCSTDILTVENVLRGIDLECCGLQVTGSREVLARTMAQNPPDLLVVDTNGDQRETERLEELARLLGRLTRVAPVLVLIAGDIGSNKNLPELQVLHADDVLIKPFSPAAFAERVQALLLRGRRDPEPAGKNRQPPAAKPLVLVVEDSPVQLNVIKRYLEDQDLDIATAAEGCEALRLIEERVPDLVLLDLVMPGMDGFELCSRLKSSPLTAEVPVIITTTLNDQENKLNCLRHGADDFISKPVDRRELLLKVKTVLKRKKQLTTLATQASKDPLTGLYNRRYMEFALKREMMEAVSSESPLSLIMLDVDNFKQYNDAFGHLAGDDVLKLIANILTAKLRQQDIIVRYGGEEFLVILPKTGPRGTALVAEKIRRSVEEYPFPHGKNQTGSRITVSIGTATFPTHACDAGELLRLADEALYRAKREGRNCFRVAE